MLKAEEMRELKECGGVNTTGRYQVFNLIFSLRALKGFMADFFPVWLNFFLTEPNISLTAGIYRENLHFTVIF